MRGNSYQIIKNQTEDEIIQHIDIGRRVIKAPRPVEITLKVSIVEITRERSESG